MSSITLIVNPDSLELSKSNLVTGTIYFNFTEKQFPEEGWNDFVVVILNWWLLSLLKIKAQKSKVEELRFMDGPLRMKIELLNTGLWKIECIRGDHDVIHQGEYNSSEIEDGVSSAAKLTIDVCDKHGWKSKDIDELKSSYHQFVTP